jgi:hypothetical protein
MPALSLNNTSSLLRRLTAALSIALLLFLSASAVSPALHEHVHGHDSDHASPSHVCAIVLFAGGLILAAAALSAAPRAVAFAPLSPLAFTALFAAQQHRLPPGRAPPAR